MSDTTPVLDLPYLLPSQAQKHVTVNESLGALDIVVQLVFQMRDQVAPPPDPQEGENYALSGAPTGVWSGYGGQLASWRDAMWHFTLPQTGWRAWSVADSELLVFDGSGWQSWLNPLPLLRFGLTDLGFSKISEIPRQDYWVPSGTEWRAFLAIR